MSVIHILWHISESLQDATPNRRQNKLQRLVLNKIVGTWERFIVSLPHESIALHQALLWYIFLSHKHDYSQLTYLFCSPLTRNTTTRIFKNNKSKPRPTEVDLINVSCPSGMPGMSRSGRKDNAWRAFCTSGIFGPPRTRCPEALTRTERSCWIV